MIIAELQKRGLINIKSALDRVLKGIGVSRNTIYDNIREAGVDAGTEK